MLKISFAGCLGLCPVISTQFTVEICVAATNRETNHYRNPYFYRSRSFKIIDHRCWYPQQQQCNCYDTQQVCVYLQPFSR